MRLLSPAAIWGIFKVIAQTLSIITRRKIPQPTIPIIGLIALVDFALLKQAWKGFK
jgi:hypothetical protein